MPDLRLHQIATGGLTANEVLLDRGIRHATFLDRLAAGEARALSSALRREVLPDLHDAVEREFARLSAAGRRSSSRLARLLGTQAELQALMRGLLGPVADSFERRLVAIAGAEAEFTTDVLELASRPLSISMAAPSSVTLRQVVKDTPVHGQILAEWFDGLGASTSRRTTVALRTSIIQGETVAEMRSRLRRVARVTTNQAEAIARTTVNGVAQAAREETYRENESLIKGERYVATLDDRTTIICASLDGRVFPIDDGPRPPQHINCRSTTVPVLKSWKEMGIDAKELPESTRASMNGEVPESTTFPKWLRRQPRAVQDEVLGPTRARLFRSNQVRFDRFTHGGRTLTLSELRKREGLSEKAVAVAR